MRVGFDPGGSLLSSGIFRRMPFSGEPVDSEWRKRSTGPRCPNCRGGSPVAAQSFQGGTRLSETTGCRSGGDLWENLRVNVVKNDGVMRHKIGGRDWPGLGRVYLLHFDRPLDDGTQHYLGFSERSVHRIEQHMKGKGAEITKRAFMAGISMQLVRLWMGYGIELEREFHIKAGFVKRGRRRGKRDDYYRRLCPLCHEMKGRNGLWRGLFRG